MSKNRRKNLRTLVFNPSSDTVTRYPDCTRRLDTLNAEILVQLTDVDEPDRYVRLDLTDDEALRLAARLAHQVGYQLVKV